MRALTKIIAEHLMHRERYSYRDRRGHYASDALKDLRDQYWSLKGEKETNAPDLKARMSMAMGDFVEKGLINDILKSLSERGIIVVGTQVAVGGSDPMWNGYLDALCKSQENGEWKTFVLEHKVKSGIGADILVEKLDPQDDHLCQLGLYLKDLAEKGVTNEGCLYYTLLSDSNYGAQLQISCRYHQETQVIEAFRADFLNGKHAVIHKEFDVSIAINRWKLLDKYLKENTVPIPEYTYKYELNDELLASISDAKLKKAINGDVVLGDWQVLYSRYKDKILETDGINSARSSDEINRMKAEYRRRHPKSKI